VSAGYRYHLTNIMASVGISQLKRVEEFILSRQKICQKYSAAFAPINGLKVPKSDFSNVSPFIYSLRVLGGRRSDLIEHLDRKHIDVGVHFIPVHKHSFFANARRGDMDVTDKVVEEVMTLPLHSNMRPDFIERVIEGVTSFFGH